MKPNDVPAGSAWPRLDYAGWAPTRRTLHLVSQMVGKTRLALAPPQPEWLHACLYLDPRGLTTGPIPYAGAVLGVLIDLYDGEVRIEDSGGRTVAVDLGRSRSIAEVWADYRAALARLGIAVDLWDVPQEVADRTPFARNEDDGTIDAGQAQRFHRLLGAIDGPFESFRSGFCGRTGIQFWWGGFDFALLLFTGRRLTAPADRGLIRRFDLDAEHLNAGFWPGDDATPEPRFWAYLVPRPPGCESAPIGPVSAAWVEAESEWILRYDEVRASPDPEQAVLDFLGSVYRVATTLGGWDAEAHRYVGPPARR